MANPPPTPLSLRTLFVTEWRWLVLLGSLPFLFLALLVLPAPFGLGRDFGNDFGDHRIWWVQMDAFWLAHGQVPLWNPVDQFGVVHVGARGMAGYYPFRWWLYFPAIWAPKLNYTAHYIQVGSHLSFALVGIFVLLRRHTRASAMAASLAAMPFLLTQRTVDFIRYPQGVEAMAWLPWILVAALECNNVELPSRDRTRWAWRLAAATALGILAAYGHLTYMGGLLIGLVLLGSSPSLRGLALPVGAALVGLVAAVGSLYPTILQTSTAEGRSGGDPAWANQFLAPGYLDTWLRPFAAELHGSAFFPPLFLFLLALGIVVALARGPRGLTIAMLAALLLIADLARGSNGVLFAWFYEHMPLYHAFRNHGRGFWPALIAVSFFSAHGLAWIEQSRRRAIVAVLLTWVATIILGALAWRAEGPSLLPAGHFGYSALELGWLDPLTARGSYAAVLASGALALSAWALGRRLVWQMSGCLLLTIVFTLGFARYSSWFVTARPTAAETSVRDAYPRGLLAPYEARSSGILGIWGTDDPPLAHYRRYVELQPASDAVFPASRFLFLPEGGTAATADVRVRNFDANHFDFEVNSRSPGTLVYFARAFRHRPEAAPWRAWPAGENLFMAFEVRPGTQQIDLSFVPASVVITGLFSLAAVTALVALAIDSRLRSRWSHGVVLVGLGVCMFLLNGTLRRHPMDARTLVGTSPASPFEWHAVPSSSQTSRLP